MKEQSILSRLSKRYRNRKGRCIVYIDFSNFDILECSIGAFFIIEDIITVNKRAVSQVHYVTQKTTVTYVLDVWISHVLLTRNFCHEDNWLKKNCVDDYDNLQDFIVVNLICKGSGEHV